MYYNYKCGEEIINVFVDPAEYAKYVQINNVDGFNFDNEIRLDEKGKYFTYK